MDSSRALLSRNNLSYTFIDSMTALRSGAPAMHLGVYFLFNIVTTYQTEIVSKLSKFFYVIFWEL